MLKTAQDRLAFSPAVVLLGPRQVGKITLAWQIAAMHPGAICLDLQLASDREKLAECSGFLTVHRHRLVVLDEVQYVPEVFAPLRPEIDAACRPGRFLLVGFASGRCCSKTPNRWQGAPAKWNSPSFFLVNLRLAAQQRMPQRCNRCGCAAAFR